MSNVAVTSAVWVLLVLAPAALIYRNLPQIRTTNGNLLREYAASLGHGLPPRGAVLFSDDPRRLLLLQFWMSQNGRSDDYLFVESGGEHKQQAAHLSRLPSVSEAPIRPTLARRGPEGI